VLRTRGFLNENALYKFAFDIDIFTLRFVAVTHCVRSEKLLYAGPG